MFGVLKVESGSEVSEEQSSEVSEVIGVNTLDNAAASRSSDMEAVEETEEEAFKGKGFR